MSDYIYYRSYAAPATLMNMVLLGVFIGMGAPKSAMFQLIFVSLLNAILSIYFVLVLKLSNKLFPKKIILQKDGVHEVL